MPTANSTASHIIVGPNSRPTNTMIADIPTNRAKVFSLLAWGCQVISVSSYEHPGKLSTASPTTGMTGEVPQSAVPADRVLDQSFQRVSAGHIGQAGQLMARLRRILGERLLGPGHASRRPQQRQRLGHLRVVVDGTGQQLAQPGTVGARLVQRVQHRQGV